MGVHWANFPGLSGRYYSTPVNIANKFAQISSTTNYDPNFQRYKIKSEKNDIFSSDNNEIYNAPFTFEELEHSLQYSENTAPGRDKIVYMMRHLKNEIKKYILAIFNKLCHQGYLPKLWRHVIIISFPKPGKAHDKAENDQLISLTSCLYKFLERMVNRRLVDYFQMKGILCKFQCGGRNRRALDHPIRLETRIRTALAKNELLVSVFYDLEKAYGRTWRYGILKDLHRTGLRGRLPEFIVSFLEDRTMSVRIRESESGERGLENGVPQGSVLSVTLFALKINGIVKKNPKDSRFYISLYVDNLQIDYHDSDPNVIQERMQNCLNKVGYWAQLSSFKLSPTKIKAMHFYANNFI